MKKFLSSFLALTLTFLFLYPVYAVDSSMEDEWLSSSAVLLDLDDWNNENYKNLHVFKNFYSLKDNQIPDVINLSYNHLMSENMNLILQYVDKGSVAILQNVDNVDFIRKLPPLSNITVTKVNDEANVILGYCLSNRENGYYLEPIFATILQGENDSTFNLEAELLDFKNSKYTYINPVEFLHRYRSKETALKKNTNMYMSVAQGRENRTPYKSAYGWGYLYGKNGTAVWGEKKGYKEFGYVETQANMYRKYMLNGRNYDELESTHTVTGRNDKYVEKYAVYDIVQSQSTYIEGYTYLNEATSYTYSTSFSMNSDGSFQTNQTIAFDVNPAKQNFTTTKLNQKVIWDCDPNSNLSNKSWKVTTSVLISKPVSVEGIAYTGIDKIVVDDIYLQYTSPCPISLGIFYT